MSKTPQLKAIRPEYDFSCGVCRNFHLGDQAGTHVVLPEPYIAKLVGIAGIKFKSTLTKTLARSYKGARPNSRISVAIDICS